MSTSPPVGRPSAASKSDQLTRTTLKESVEARIRRSLLSGEMQVGEIYSANSLASQLGISNSPAREAMMSLTHRGLLELVRNRGFRVVELDEHDKREIYELRLQIEVEAVRRAARLRLDPEQVDLIAALSDRTVELAGGDLLDYLEADHAYHLSLVGLTGNRRWTEMVAMLRDQSRINGRYNHLRGCSSLRRTADEHQRITRAVIDGESELAAALMVEHLEYARPSTA